MTDAVGVDDKAGWPVRLLDAATSAVHQIGAQALDGWRSLGCLHRRPVLLVTALAWAAGIIGDAWTTLAMMRTGVFEEANPTAALGMGGIGTEAYVALASLICLALAVVSLGRAPGLYARVILVASLVLALFKAYTALSNALLWMSVG